MMSVYFRRLARASILLAAASAMTPSAQAAAPAEIVVQGERVYPESLTSASDGTVIIGGLGSHAIYRAKPGSAAAELWIAAGTDGLQSVLGVFADEKSNTLWACSSTFAAPGSPPPPGADLHAFDLKSGASKARYPLPTAGSLCNDIAIAKDGTLYVTDTRNMQVLRLKKGAASLEVWAGGEGFGPKDGVLDGIALLGQRVLVNALVENKLYSVPIESDGRAGAIVEVKLDQPISRPDGMRSFGKNSLLLVDAAEGGRLSLVTLKGDEGVVKTLKSGFADGPTAVTLVGTNAYVLEAQLAKMRANPPVPSSSLNPFRATAVPVGKP